LNKKKSIKNSLLDQSIISGLGNIYVCEALFRSKINPKKNCSKLVTSKGRPKKNLILLVQKINEVIKEAIEVGGSTLRDFSNISGKMGYFQSSFNVYNRENEKCLLDDCDGVIKRIIQSGRSTFFCSKCQK
jgi:formamidopyrimidine-DNA glycosylase